MVTMIIFVDVSLKEIFNLKEKFPWPRPETCPNCNSFRVWKHGFVIAFFDGFESGVSIRRYRCPDCRCVMRMRPVGYFSRFQSSISTIRSSISYKFFHGKWHDWISKSRQRHWFVALKRKIRAYFGDMWKKGPLNAFDSLIAVGINPASRSI